MQSGVMESLERARQGRTAAWRYLICTPMALTLTTVMAAAVILPSLLLGLLPKDFAAALTDPGRPIPFFAATGVMFGLLNLGFILAVRRIHAKSFQNVVGRWVWRDVVSGVFVWAAGLTMLLLVDYRLDPAGFGIGSFKNIGLVALTAVLGLGFQTFAEEYVFRGYITQGLLLWFKTPWIAAVTSGLAFGALHLPNGLPQAANALVFGCVLARLAIAGNGIGFTFGIHFINNLFAALGVVSTDDLFTGGVGLFTQHTPALIWWDVASSSFALVAIAALRLCWPVRRATRSAREPN